jgi:hypothetical protein
VLLRFDEHYKPREPLPNMWLNHFVRAYYITATDGLMSRWAVNTKSVVCTAYPTSPTSYLDLVSSAKSFDAIADCNNPTQLTLIFNPSASPKYGGFKKATFGHVSGFLLGPSSQVCIKQCWYECKVSKARLTFDSATQAVKLSSEINCLRWASGLMDLVYAFVQKEISARGEPSFQIPSMRFVNTALVVADNNARDTYMIEEVIDEATDGSFVKYIGNSSARPLIHLDQNITYRAAFLAFSQHVQYMKTKHLAFVGDLQGKYHPASPLHLL